MHSRAVVRLFGGASVLLAVLLMGAEPALANAKRHGPKRGFGRGTSTNWSGYAVDGSSATYVVGTWTQPSVVCQPGENSWSSPWVGIDGDNSNTVEQTGTDGDCQGGNAVYYAWYEMYPKSLVTIPMAVTPGDSYTGSVTYSSVGFTLALTDNTSHKTFTTTQSSKKARRSSDEWIMEGPSSGLLSNFGSVNFTGASGTIGGQSVAASNGQSITMVTNGGTPRAVPSSASGGAFSVAWRHS